jgi:hypothetical protein
VRRDEQKSRPALKRSRYLWLKNAPRRRQWHQALLQWPVIQVSRRARCLHDLTVLDVEHLRFTP